MRAEEIKGLMEAYSKVNETPEVLIEENLNEASAGEVFNRVVRGTANYLKDAPAAAMSQLQGQGAVKSNDAALARQQRRAQNLQTLVTTGRLPGSSAAKPTKKPDQKPLIGADGRNVFDGTPGPSSTRPNPPSPSTRPAPTDSPSSGKPTVSSTVLAKKGGVEGKLDKATGKFTAGNFTDAEKTRYAKFSPKPATPAPTVKDKPTAADKPTTPATPQKPKASAMDQWRAANPKLAAAADEKARIRGTSQTDNPLIDKEMRARMPMTPSVQSPTLQKDLGNLAKNYTSLTQNPNASKAATPTPAPKPTPTPTPAATTATDTIKKSSTTKPTMKESNLDAFDLVKEYLLDEGYAETEQNAMVIMVNMSEEWRSEILDELYKGKHGQSEKEYMAGRSDAGKRISGDEKEGPASYASRWHKGSEPTKPGQKPKNVQKLAKWEKDHLEIRKNDLKKKEEEKKVAKEEIELDEAQRARENPEGHDKEEKRKYEPVRGEKTPMPPRGDKRREEFEKWYAKQMGR